MAGIPVEVELKRYGAKQSRLENRDEILFAMMVFGFLPYHDGFLRIPWRNLKKYWKDRAWVVSQISLIIQKNVLDAMITLDTEKVAKYIK